MRVTQTLPRPLRMNGANTETAGEEEETNKQNDEKEKKYGEKILLPFTFSMASVCKGGPVTSFHVNNALADASAR